MAQVETTQPQSPGHQLPDGLVGLAIYLGGVVGFGVIMYAVSLLIMAVFGVPDPTGGGGGIIPTAP